MTHDLFQHCHVELIYSCFFLALSHKLNASYDKGCCGLNSLAASAISLCLSNSSTSSNRSLGLKSISAYPCCVLLVAARREKKACTWLLVSHSSCKQPIVLFISCCLAHIVRNLLRVCLVPCLLPKVKPRSGGSRSWFDLVSNVQMRFELRKCLETLHASELRALKNIQLGIMIVI